MPTRTGAKSITHEHLLGVVATETRVRRRTGPVRLLDVGCGDGALLGYFASMWARLDTGVDIELFGFDVRDHGVQEAGFMDATLRALDADHPTRPWASTITSLSQRDPWPYEDGSFDVVVSNQVLEHVADHDRLFGELRRTLRQGGYAAHLFPLKHYVWEAHLHLPLAHRIAYFELSKAYIRALSRLGLGKFPLHRREFGASIDTFSERHADYLLHYTNYLTYREVTRLAKKHGLRPSFRYTRDFYTLKLKSMLGSDPSFALARQTAVGEWLSFLGLRYVSSITLFLEKRESYRP